MKEEEARIFIDLILDMAWEVRALKEAECENLGKIWYDRFIKQLPNPSKFR